MAVSGSRRRVEATASLGPPQRGRSALAAGLRARDHRISQDVGTDQPITSALRKSPRVSDRTMDRRGGEDERLATWEGTGRDSVGFRFSESPQSPYSLAPFRGLHPRAGSHSARGRTYRDRDPNRGRRPCGLRHQAVPTVIGRWVANHPRASSATNSPHRGRLKRRGRTGSRRPPAPSAAHDLHLRGPRPGPRATDDRVPSLKRGRRNGPRRGSRRAGGMDG